jgi:malonyl-CoA O-methyltransferase
MSFAKNTMKSPMSYVEAAVIARETHADMLTRLEWMTIKPAVILDVSCGAGENSENLRARFAEAKVISHHSKLSEKMAMVLPDQSVDLVFANLFLPWQHDVKTVLQEWRRILTPNGLLMLSAFGLDTLQEWRAVIPDEETPVRVDMHDVGDALIQSGFADPVLDVSHYQLTYRDQTHLVDELLASDLWFPDITRDAGQDKWPAPNDHGVWPLTYEVIYAHAFAPEISDEYAPSEDGIVKIPLAHLRRRLTG